MKNNKSIYAFGIWIIPVLLILLEATIFLSKVNWKSPFIPYAVTFWGLRAVLAPLIVLYTLKFWGDHTRAFRLFAVHVGGFFLFSLLFWTGAYLILHGLLHKSDFFGWEKTSTNMQVFSMIVDNSISTNSIVYVSTVAFCYIWEFLKKNTIINKKAMDLERSLLTSRLELLKGQLNTHFLFNTLHTISSFVVRKQNEEANKMLVRLGELLRFSLKENKQQLIPLHKEMELLRLYLDIQETRFKDRLQLDVQVQPSVSNSLVPSLLLQPIVENAVKYGVEPFHDKGKISIDIHSNNGKLVIQVRDNGKRDFNEIDFNSGIGLSNTRERLRQLYAGNQKLSIVQNASGQGVLVAIEIPNQTSEHAIESAYSG
ncbi:MAG TPA: histidine kinase [Chitinophagaceae bacterium]|nr:histidine kinase [Chitinophagaceae bacterium]